MSSAREGMLRDQELRAAVYRQLLAIERSRADTRLIDELGISHGSVRVDIAVINGHIHGLELKADADSLARLPRQVEGYGRAVDRATLIAADRHVKKAMTIIPHWWGVISASRNGSDEIVFRRVRLDRTNKKIDPLTLAKLLWRSEAIAALEAVGCDRKTTRAARSTLYAELVARLSREKLAELVRETLKNRNNWRDRQPPSLYGG